MRGRLTEQDLTDYALNELAPDERLYVESMLGASEECRNDVVQMLEMGEMLKDCMRRAEEEELLMLSDEQRTKVLEVPAWNWRGVIQKAAAILMLSAGTAFIATRPGIWQKTGVAVDGLASAGQAVQEMVADAQELGFARSVEEFRSRLEGTAGQLAEAEADWQFAAQPAVCTPPVWTMDEPLPEIAEM
jgi:anti-sigma factor RsiW